MFGHEKFGAYNTAIEFIGNCSKMIDSFPRGHGDLVNQLNRASVSIALNIAEGSGKNSDRDKRRYYAIARGSAMECAAILDVLVQIGLVSSAEVLQLKESLSKVAAILSKVCNNNR